MTYKKRRLLALLGIAVAVFAAAVGIALGTTEPLGLTKMQPALTPDPAPARVAYLYAVTERERAAAIDRCLRVEGATVEGCTVVAVPCPLRNSKIDLETDTTYLGSFAPNELDLSVESSSLKIIFTDSGPQDGLLDNIEVAVKITAEQPFSVAKMRRDNYVQMLTADKAAGAPVARTLFAKAVDDYIECLGGPSTSLPAPN